MKTLFKNVLLGIASTLFFASCDKKFDTPPINGGNEEHLTPNITIAKLKESYTTAGNFKKINEEHIIEGIVIADDKSNNVYKRIIIQDATGGIEVVIEGAGLHTQYPIGRKVFIKLKGLMIGDYNSNIQIGLDSVRSNDGKYLNIQAIPTASTDKYIVKGSMGNQVTPKVITIADLEGKPLNDPIFSTLVQITNVEFVEKSLGKTYADTTKKTSAVNHNFYACANNKQTVTLRTSSHATFAGVTLPSGNGSIIGIPSLFGTTRQFTIRDTNDVQMTNQRCTTTPTPPASTEILKSIKEVLAYTQGDSTIPANTFIEGIIISESSNEANLNYRVQDATGGIQIRLKAAASTPIKLGDKVKIEVGNNKISIFQGGLQVNNIQNINITGTGSITPKAITLAEIIANPRAFESTVVSINNVSFTEKSPASSSGTTYTVKDATGEVETFVRKKANIKIPSTPATTVIAYVSIFQARNATTITPQITLRTQADIQ